MFLLTFIPVLRSMSAKPTESSELPRRLGVGEDAMLERECRVAGVLLLLCAVGAVVLGIALWA